jgi:hypothetical protein
MARLLSGPDLTAAHLEQAEQQVREGRWRLALLWQIVPRLLDGGTLLLPTATYFEGHGWHGEVLADDGEAEEAIPVGDLVPTREQAVANAMEAIANWEPVE